jgi:hypothetical protein
MAMAATHVINEGPVDGEARAHATSLRLAQQRFLVAFNAFVDTMIPILPRGHSLHEGQSGPLRVGPFPTESSSTHSLELSVAEGFTTSNAFVTITVITPHIT